MVLLTLHSIIQKLHLLGEAKAIFNYVTNTHYKAKQKSTLSEFTSVFEQKTVLIVAPFAQPPLALPMMARM